MLLLINEFRGTAPRLNPEQLADGLSVIAENVDLSETLQGWCSPLPLNVSVPAATTHLFYYENTYWFSWSEPTYAVDAPLLNDPFKTVVITDTAYPKITRLDIATGGAVHPNVTYRLGLPIPPTVDSLLVSDNELYTGLDGDDPDYDGTFLDDFTVNYKLVYVDAWGRLSAGSDPSENVDIREYDGQMVLKVTLTLPAAHNGYTLLTGAKYRIYRLNTSSTGTGVYQYVDEVDVTDTSYVDRITSDDLQEAITSDDWIGPPDDNTTDYPNGPLKHVCVVSEAFLCGHNSKMVCFSEPRIAHAWPAAYYMIFAEKVVRTVSFGSDVVVLTDDHPYVLMGVHPENMSRIRLANPAPCINSEAVAEVSGAVFFAGKRGLYMISGTEVSLVSETFYTTKEWRTLRPEDMRFVRHHDALFINLWDGRILAFDPSNPQGGFTTIDLETRALYTDVQTEGLIFSDNTGELFEFDGGDSFMPVSYESKHYRFHRDMNLYCGRVRANSYPVDVTFVAERRDGEEIRYEKTVENDTFFYVPTKSDTVEWWFEVDGDVDIRSIGLASSVQELNQDV